MENTKQPATERQGKKYLFICGNPRSGTSLTAELIGHNQHIAMGIERFGYWDEPRMGPRLGPRLFSKERFFDFRPSDTFPEAISHNLDHYESARLKFDDAMYVGDKLPGAFRYMPELNRDFPDLTMIFCYRNAYDMAASWNARRDDPDDHLWNPRMGHTWAIRLWNDSLRCATAAKKAGYAILPCDYDALTAGNDYYLELLNSLGITPDDRDDEFCRTKIAPRDPATRRGLDPRVENEITALIDTREAAEFGQAFGVDLSGLLAPRR